MKKLFTSVIYENPLPQLKSRQAVFPWLCQTKDGTLLASFSIGEAFESVDLVSYISKSTDGGLTWSDPVCMFDNDDCGIPLTNCCKITTLDDGRIAALGYAYKRNNPEFAIGNPETGGLLEDFVFYSISDDNGESWKRMNKIECCWGPHVEASAPITLLKDGSWITPITGFPDWNGNMTGDICGRALVSKNNGKTWNDDAICMKFNGNITCYEQRMCQLESGTIICIGWNEDADSGERLENHFTYSTDNAKTWSAPETTGIMGQASSVCALGGERFLALHAVRRDTDRPGIYAYIINFSDKKWNIIEKEVIWEPATPIVKDAKMADIFSFLKFGQPGAIVLDDGNILISHWYAQDGQYKTLATKIKL